MTAIQFVSVDMADKLCSKMSWKSVFMSGLVVYAFIFGLRITQPNFYYYSLAPFQLLWNIDSKGYNVATFNQPATNTHGTNISHIFFAIAGSMKTWNRRRLYVDQWWRPNTTRGYVWIDKAPDPKTYVWTPNSPPYQIYGNTSKFKNYAHFGLPFTIRIMRVMLEAYNIIGNHSDHDIRWFVMVDDDTILFIDNLVELLGQYDHKGYHYIGGISECVLQNYIHSFSMAYGGAGYAISYPLVKAMSRILEGCIKRYQNVYGSNQVTESCMKDLGVSLTRHQGFHQFDLVGDISGLLSAHPQAPLISFHHLDHLNSIFPHLNRYGSVRQLMKVAAVDSSRLLQQSVCYDTRKNWSFSISWGYTVQIYDIILPPSLLQTPVQTFRPWNNRKSEPSFMFNVRSAKHKDSCMAPNVLHFVSIQRKYIDGHVVSNYGRRKTMKFQGGCKVDGNDSATFISRVQVISPPKRFDWSNGRKECCEIANLKGNMAQIKVKACLETEALNEPILYRDD